MLKRKNHAGKKPAILPLVCAAAALAAFGTGELRAQAKAGGAQAPLFLTATNGATNFLAVVNTQTKEVNFVPTGGAGGIAGGSNAGGVAVEGKIAAVVNFNSSTVTIFMRKGSTMEATETITTSSKPVSVAFGNGHLVVLGLSSAESFAVTGPMVAQTHDGIVQLLMSDGTAAQIVTYAGGAMYSEKSGEIGQINFGIPGLVGPSNSVMLPAAPNNNTPFGMVGRGANVYVTIAHSNLEALVVNGKIISSAAGPSPYQDASGSFLHAPCWNALAGHFLFSADSPGKQLLRYLVSDNNIFLDKINVAQFAGSPTDLDIQGGLVGVIDLGDTVNSNVTLFDMDSEGELKLRFTLKIAGAIFGAAIIK